MRAISNARVRIFSAEGSLLAEVWDPVYDFTIYYGIAVVKSMGRGVFFLEVRAPISPAVGHFVKADSGRNIKMHGLWRGGRLVHQGVCRSSVK